MRRIAIINQKGGVGKTTTTANLGAALAIQGRRVVVVDMDAQANLSLALGVEVPSGEPTSYSVLLGEQPFGACLRETKVPGLSLVASNIDLSGAEMELASAMGREFLLRDALKEWDAQHRARTGRAPADYVLFDCPPSLGLLSINALASAGEVLITLQTEFLALQGMSKLVEVVQLLKRRLNPELVITGIVPTLYDSRLKLAREVLGEIRTYFKGLVVPQPVRANVKLAETPSFAQTIFEYAPDSNGAYDYMMLAKELLSRESRDPDLASLAPFDEKAALPLPPSTEPAPPKRVPPPPQRGPRKPAAVPSSPASATSEATIEAPAHVPETASRVAEAPPAVEVHAPHADVERPTSVAAPRASVETTTQSATKHAPPAAQPAAPTAAPAPAASATDAKMSNAKTANTKAEKKPEKKAHEHHTQDEATTASSITSQPAASTRKSKAQAKDVAPEKSVVLQPAKKPVKQPTATPIPSSTQHTASRTEVPQPAAANSPEAKAVPPPTTSAKPASMVGVGPEMTTDAPHASRPSEATPSAATHAPAVTSRKANSSVAPSSPTSSAAKPKPAAAPKSTKVSPPKPAPKTATKSTAQPKSAAPQPSTKVTPSSAAANHAKSEPRVVRAHELPPLPPDAFEMLSTPFEP